MSSSEASSYRRPSVHRLLVNHLRQVISQRAVVWDASTAGSEEVILVLDIGGNDRSPDAAAGPIATSNDTIVPSGSHPLLNSRYTGRAALHLLLISPIPLAWLEPTSRKKPLPPSGFGRWLKSRIQGLKISGVSCGESGRIIQLDFELGDAERLSLVLDPLANACRLLIFGKDKIVEQRYPAPIHASASGRCMPGTQFTEPATESLELWERWLGEDCKIGSPPQTGTSDQANIETSQLSPSATHSQLWLYKRETTSDSVRAITGIPVFISPIESPDALEAGTSILSGPLPPIAAAALMGRSLIATERLYETHRQMNQTLRSERKHLKRLLKRVNKEVLDARGGEELRRQAEAILVSAAEIPRGASECDLPDPANPEIRMIISLDPSRSFSDNASRLFKQAGRMERALAAREQKAKQINLLLDFIESGLTVLKTPSPLDHTGDLFPLTAPALKEIVKKVKSHKVPLDPGLQRRWHNMANNLSANLECLNTPTEHIGYEARRSGAPTSTGSTATSKSSSAKQSETKPEHWGPTDAAAERAGIHPRRYLLPGGWVVLVGRTNTENDKLSHKAARQRDLWFHARGVSGSHVVLQRGSHKDNPSREVLHLTAAIAAFYSKAKTSGMVPVMYTEKRYVRKPRKAPPGLAVCIREKVLMVEPSLPKSVFD